MVTEETLSHDCAIKTARDRGYTEENVSVARLGEMVLFQRKQVHTLILNALVHDEIKFNIEKWD